MQTPRCPHPLRSLLALSLAFLAAKPLEAQFELAESVWFKAGSDWVRFDPPTDEVQLGPSLWSRIDPANFTPQVFSSITLQNDAGQMLAIFAGTPTITLTPDQGAAMLSGQLQLEVLTHDTSQVPHPLLCYIEPNPCATKFVRPLTRIENASFPSELATDPHLFDRGGKPHFGPSLPGGAGPWIFQEPFRLDLDCSPSTGSFELTVPNSPPLVEHMTFHIGVHLAFREPPIQHKLGLIWIKGAPVFQCAGDVGFDLVTGTTSWVGTCAGNLPTDVSLVDLRYYAQGTCGVATGGSSSKRTSNALSQIVSASPF